MFGFGSDCYGLLVHSLVVLFLSAGHVVGLFGWLLACGAVCCYSWDGLDMEKMDSDWKICRRRCADYFQYAISQRGGELQFKSNRRQITD
jgi:hypothetical protein